MAPLVIVGAKSLTSERLDRHASAIKRLARVESIEHAAAAPRGSAQIVIGEATACLPLGNLIDLAAEKSRLEKDVAKVEVERQRILGKLANEKFVANAKAEVVQAERDRLAELDLQVESLRVALSRLSEAD
jgi:valyl-tRNA synthetase